MAPKWYNIYGPQSHSGSPLTDKHFKHYQRYPESAPNFRGRVLMSLREDKNKKLKEPEVMGSAARMPGDARWLMRWG